LSAQARVTFRAYRLDDRARCLAIFDANCPDFFAPTERPEYESFLDAGREGYQVCLVDGETVGAFGVIDEAGWHLHWMLIDPEAQGRGIGSTIMTRVSEIGDGRPVSIAASHKSASFFARFGARVVRQTPDGWGEGMHRVDMEF
jgi:GNAT superfamily N-acetyltransferase